VIDVRYSKASGQSKGALEEAKARLSLRQLMTKLGLAAHAKRSAKCPFHEDRNNSFSVFQNSSGEWVWNCFAGCGGGDAASFLARFEGISNSDACRKLIGLAGGRVATAQCLHMPKIAKALRRGCRPIDIYDPSDQDIRVVQRMVETLVSDTPLCERIARGRGWKRETIRQLALETYLGWHDGKLAFIYDTGVKLRWRHDGERVIRWAFGKPWLWRGAWIKSAQTIYLCEGETDAITLIDAGIETDRATVVVALPSASTFDGAWAALFEGKDVILAFDNDKAGSEATARVSKLLRSSKRSLKRLNWEGLQYASAN
jgi:5S rRNA maturation endonuclease (ribonuclease M5)